MKLFQKDDMIMIIGCGGIGSVLACDSSENNKAVAVIDINEDAFQKLPHNFRGFTFIGDGTQTEVLEAAGIRKADCLVAATNDDDINIMIAQIASIHFKVKTVIAKISDIKKKVTCDRLNIQSICPVMLFISETEKLLAYKREEAAV